MGAAAASVVMVVMDHFDELHLIAVGICHCLHFNVAGDFEDLAD